MTNIDSIPVENIVENNPSIVLVVESPHICEVKYGYPLAGSSGLSVSDYLFNICDISIGTLLSDKSIKNEIEKREKKEIPNFSIINISKYPLQEKAYKNNKDKISEFLDFFKNKDIDIDIKDINQFREYISQRKDTDAKYSPINIKYKQIFDTLYGIFENNYKKEINNNEEEFKNIIIIPCGNFAKIFTRRLLEDKEFREYKENEIYERDSNKIKLITMLPHPSHNLWSSISDDTFKFLKNIFNITSIKKS